MNQPSYPNFVYDRFKSFEGSKALTLHHATTGLVGEAVEIMYARSRDQMLKELGDFEFYLEAFLQHLPISVYSRGGVIYAHAHDLISCFDLLIARSTDLLDLTKKMWIYEQDVDVEMFWDAIPQIRGALVRIYDILGTNRDEIIRINREKLEKRYPHGYSNKAAQERADGEPIASVLATGANGLSHP